MSTAQCRKNLQNIQGKNAFVTVKKASLDILPRDKICNVRSALQGTEMECLFQLKDIPRNCSNPFVSKAMFLYLTEMLSKGFHKNRPVGPKIK